MRLCKANLTALLAVLALSGAAYCGQPPAKAAAPGTAETFTASGIKAGTIYFAIKSRDRLNNESDISNVVKLEVK